MAQPLNDEALAKLKSQKVIWFGSVRSDGRPHMAPIWFIWLAERIYVSTDPKSVKRKNIGGNPRVSLALEDGEHPVICEGTAKVIAPPWADEIKAAFFKKYDWDLDKEPQYNEVIEVTPERWLIW